MTDRALLTSKLTPGLITLAGGLAFMALFFILLPHPAMIAPDSQGYLTWDISRTPGYPALLWLLQRLDPTLSALPFAQMGLFAVSAAVMIHLCHQARPAALGWSLCGLLVVANPFLWRYAMQMMTESPYISLTMLGFGCAVASLGKETPSWRMAGLAGLCIGLAILVRPTGYACWIALAFVPLAWPRRRLLGWLAFLGPVAVLIGGVSLWNGLHRGYYATQAFGGINLLGHVAFFVGPHPDQPAALQPLAAEIAADLAPAAQQIRGQTDPIRHYWMTAYGFNIALWDRMAPMLARRAPADISTDMQRQLWINDAAWSLSKSAIRAEPGEYVKQVLINFAAAWVIPAAASNAEIESVKTYLCEPAFQNFYCGSPELDSVGARGIPAAAATLKTILLGSAMLASLAVLGLYLLRRDGGGPLLGLLALASLFINGNHGLTALVEAALPRYSMAAWPFLCVMLAGLSIWLYKSGRGFLTRARF